MTSGECHGSPRAAGNSGSTLPVVLAADGDPGDGLAASMARASATHWSSSDVKGSATTRALSFGSFQPGDDVQVAHHRW